jgi:hypothetical protein
VAGLTDDATAVSPRDALAVSAFYSNLERHLRVQSAVLVVGVQVAELKSQTNQTKTRLYPSPWTLASLSLLSPQTTTCVPGKMVLGDTMTRYLLAAVANLGLVA